MSVTVKTNNVPRHTLDGYDLTDAEREEFDYIDWDKVDAGSESCTFVRYLGTLYDLGEFSNDFGITKNVGLPAHLSKWDGYFCESAFSAIVVRLVDSDHVVMGMVTT